MDIQPCIGGFWREGERVRRYLIASIFGLPPPEDRDAAMALLDETAAARRA